MFIFTCKPLYELNMRTENNLHDIVFATNFLVAINFSFIHSFIHIRLSITDECPVRKVMQTLYILYFHDK